MTRKVLILKGVGRYDDWGDESFVCKESEYHEVDDETYSVLRSYLHYIYDKDGTIYKVIEYVQPEEAKDIITRCREYHDKYEAEQAARAVQRKKQLQKSTEKALERKRRQLDKLKKELGEAS